jgi:hypothetical protein
MEILKNYLESMFMNLPNTAEVRRAKDELWQMMEDKYAELKDEGKSENEVIGIIISEFGNLDEIAEELGIETFVRPQGSFDTAQESGMQGDFGSAQQSGAQGGFGAAQHTAEQYNNAQQGYGTPGSGSSGSVPPFFRRMVTMEEAKEYLRDKASGAFLIAFGVMLCILSVVPPIAIDAVGVNDAYGAALMFIIIAVAVACFVANGIRQQKWEFLQKEPCSIDFATSNMVSEKKEQYRSIYTMFLVIGIMLCIISVVPAIILDELMPALGFLDSGAISGAALFVLVGVGVFLIVLGSCTQGSFTRLLSLNDAGTMAGNYAAGSAPKYRSGTVAKIMSVYWQTVTCIYLIWSFLSFAWWRTWIIWPVAAILCSVINAIWKTDND